MKLMVRVMKALEEGADTSTEIAEMLKHPVASVSATLSEMEESGLARKTGRYRVGERGKRANCWERA